ncbi:MAG TPA: substrate-binding protein [Acetobacteraceae bacterium]|nr:substrate-binding protein [Acetobacteraceae bacterium]
MASDIHPVPSRRAVLRVGAGLAGTAALSGLARPAAAAEPAMGTWPAGSSGETVFVGITVPRTGPYQLPGDDELKGYELALDHLNAGHALMRAIAPKVTKGLLGKQVMHGVADTEAKPNVAVQGASHFISENKAVMFTGSCSSAVAVALNKLAQREKVIYLPGVSGSNDTTGKDCTRYSFRTCFYGQTSSAALAPVMIKNFGRNKKVAFLTPDYTYGHTVQESMLEYLGKGGWKMVSNQVSPLGTPDFSAYLLNVANSGADVVVNINWGNDAFQSVKQAAQFGILKKMKMVVAYDVPFLAKEVTPELTQNMLNATDFWWTLESKYPLAKMFVAEFHKKYGYNPQWSAEAAYMQIACWARMVSGAGTFYPPAVIKEYEKGEHFNSLVGDVWFRPQDHQLVRPVFLMRGKKPSAMKTPDDYWDVIQTDPGLPLMQPPGAFGCKLGPYV